LGGGRKNGMGECEKVRLVAKFNGNEKFVRGTLWGGGDV